MQLYFTPMTCSLASRMALCHAGLDAETEFLAVSLQDKRVADGRDYLEVNPKGAVPALVTREGQLLTESLAVLQYIADLAPESRLAPPQGSFQRVRLQEWLSFVACELHKAVFYSIFHPEAPEQGRQFAREVLAPPRLGRVNEQLTHQPFLLKDWGFTVADAYLATVLNWCRSAGIDLDRWPHLKAFHARVLELEGVARAQQEEYRIWTAA